MVPRKIDLAADHADAGPVAEDIFRILRIDAADHANAAAVELGKGVAHRAEHPHFRSLIVRVPFGHGQAAGADGAADHHPAAGHGVADAVGGIALDDDIRADVEIADIVRGRALADDGRALQAHAAEPLPGRSLDPVWSAAARQNQAAGRCCAGHRIRESVHRQPPPPPEPLPRRSWKMIRWLLVIPDHGQ